MFRGIRVLAAASIATIVAACGSKKEEFIVVDPEPISTEPVYTGKYK